MKIELEDSDIERIAAAVAKVIGAAPSTTASAAPKNGKSKAADGASKPAEKTEDNAEVIQKRRGEVLAKVKLLGEKTSREEAKALVQNYAPSMGEVKPSDFDALEADLDAKLKPSDKAPEDDY